MFTKQENHIVKPVDKKKSFENFSSKLYFQNKMPIDPVPKVEYQVEKESGGEGFLQTRVAKVCYWTYVPHMVLKEN